MFGTKKYKQPEDDSELGLEDRELADATEDKPIPLFWGEAIIPGTFITPVYKQFSRPAPNEFPAGKK